MKILKMGNRFNKYKLFVSLSKNRILISEKSLNAICEISAYLKLNVRVRPVFQATGYQRRVRQIAAYIQAGTDGIRPLLQERTPVEVAAGLQYYLIRLSKPLLPLNMQTLALDANADIRPDVVAADILGLIRQDIRGRHLELITTLLDLLYFYRKNAAANELAGSDIPITMLPVFFQLQSQHIVKWRLIANIFMELIDLSPNYLPFYSDYLVYNPDDMNNGNFRFPQTIDEDHQRFLDDNLVLHQTLVQTGNNGDAHSPEIVNILHNRTHPTILNSVFGYSRRN